SHEPVRYVWLPDSAAVLDIFARVFLHEDPAITAILQRSHKLVENVGMVGQRHLRWGKSPDAAERVKPEDRCELMLPGGNMQTEILHRGGGRHRMAPCGTEPFRTARKRRIERDPLQIIE